VVNELNVSLQHSILTLAAHGWSHRRIARELDINRETVGKYLRLVKSKPAISTPGSEADPAPEPAISTPGSKTTPPLPEKRTKTKDQIQVQRKFDRRTGELNGSLSGSARFISLLKDYGKPSIFTVNYP
jgi:hypothetical protein